MTTLEYYTLPLGSVGLFVLYDDNFNLVYRHEIQTEHYNVAGKLIYFFNTKRNLQITIDHKTLDLQKSAHKKIILALDSIKLKEPTLVLYRLSSKGHETNFFTFKILDGTEVERVHSLFEKRDITKLRTLLTKKGNKTPIPHPRDFLKAKYSSQNEDYTQSNSPVDTDVVTFPTDTSSGNYSSNVLDPCRRSPKRNGSSSTTTNNSIPDSIDDTSSVPSYTTPFAPKEKDDEGPMNIEEIDLR
mgnify:FL=1